MFRQGKSRLCARYQATSARGIASIRSADRDDIEGGALWEDTKLGFDLAIEHHSDWKRSAIVTDIDWTVDEGWHGHRIEPYGPLQMDPASAVLHYGQEIFEGMKAYRRADGSVWTFRPDQNAQRMQRSAARLALPQIPEELFLEAIRRLVEVDEA